MAQLRNFGVYRLPDNHPYVLVRGGGDRYFLFDCDLRLKAAPVFEVAQGRVRRWLGSGAEYGVEDLEDTGETFERGHRFRCPD